MIAELYNSTEELKERMAEAQATIAMLTEGTAEVQAQVEDIE